MAGDINKATPEELAQVADFCLLVRSIMVELAKTTNHIDAAMNAWNANILQIIGSPQDIAIKDDNNLAGSTVLTDTQLTNLVSYMSSIQQTFGSAKVKTDIVLAVGPKNTIG